MTVDIVGPAIERLYAAFAHVPKPLRLEYCTHCWSAEEERALLAPVPLREIPAETLRCYAADVLLTVGEVADFRYFLPRIYELSVTGGFTFPDLEMVAHRLGRAGWREWAPAERDAISGLWHAVWTGTLAKYPSDLDPDAVLCAIGGVDDLTGYLAEWEAALSTLAGAVHLAEYLDFGVGNGTLTNAYWAGAEDGATVVLDWLARMEPVARTVVESEAVLHARHG